MQTNQTTLEFINIYVTWANNLQKKIEGELFYIVPSVVAAMYHLLKAAEVMEVMEWEVMEVMEWEVMELLSCKCQQGK